MKKLIFILILGICFTQTYEDVVILKNGSEIHGIIIEQKPNEYIKIQSGKNIFVYQMDEIELIKKELVEDEDNSNNKKSKSDLSKNQGAIGLGFGTLKMHNLIQMSYEKKIFPNLSIYPSIGYPTLVGIGLNYQQNYNQNGLIVCGNMGIDSEYLTKLSIQVAYQWQIGDEPNFFSIGIGILQYEYYNEDYEGDSWDLETLSRDIPIPVISFDRRF